MPSLTHFSATRRAHWAELEQLLARSEGNGLRGFDAAQIEALGRAYRQVISDLAIARRDFPEDQVTLWLNDLASRAHLRLYRAPPPRGAGLASSSGPISRAASVRHAATSS